MVQETPSNSGYLLNWWPTAAPASYFTFTSGGLGWNGPAAVGIALAQQKIGSGRAVIAFMGDGSFQYSIQSLYTAAQHRLRLICIVLCNDEYAILENTPNVPALDLPGLDIVSTAKQCHIFCASNLDASIDWNTNQKWWSPWRDGGGPERLTPTEREGRKLMAEVMGAMP